MSKFKDRVVVVTGAGTGVGLAISEAFVNEGAKVAFAGRRKEKLEAAAADMPQDRVMVCPCDVADREAVNDMIGRVTDRFGTVHILVNNAGINASPRSVGEVNPEDWDQIVNINLNGVFNTVRAVLPKMREQKDGLIINISSIAGVRGSKLAGAPYAASKHGVVALSQTLNEEEMDYNIRSCAICPGEIDTPILDQRPVPVSPEHRASILKTDDLAAAALFVASFPSRVTIPILIIKPTSQVFQ